MGGQTATPDGLQLDMREFRGVVALDTAARTITVHSGTRWREVQEAIDPAGLAVKIMQTYNTFTVGGALSVNAHGRYIGQGPLVRSVRAITLVLADGRIVRGQPGRAPRALLRRHRRLRRRSASSPTSRSTSPTNSARAAHRFDAPVADYLELLPAADPARHRSRLPQRRLYPPAYEVVHAVSYVQTATAGHGADRRIQPADQASWTHRLGYEVITSGRLGKWLREHIVDPVIFRGEPGHLAQLRGELRRERAGACLAGPTARTCCRSTSCRSDSFDGLRAAHAAHPPVARVNAVNVSIRHALPDPGTILAWAPAGGRVRLRSLLQAGDRPGGAAARCGRWTRELIEAAIQSGGRYYLPYQPLATREQFTRAYPRATELFALKRRIDPTGKFTNTLWDLYEPGPNGRVPDVSAAHMPAQLPAEVSVVLDTIRGYVAVGRGGVPDASRVGPGVLERGLRAVAARRQGAERIPLRAVGGHLLAQLPRHVARQPGALPRRVRDTRHARSHRHQHRRGVRPEGYVRGDGGTPLRAGRARRRHGGRPLRGTGRGRVRAAHQPEGVVRILLRARSGPSLDGRAVDRAGDSAEVGATLRADAGVRGQGGLCDGDRLRHRSGVQPGRSPTLPGGRGVERLSGSARTRRRRNACAEWPGSIVATPCSRCPATRRFATPCSSSRAILRSFAWWRFPAIRS